MYSRHKLAHFVTNSLVQVREIIHYFLSLFYIIVIFFSIQLLSVVCQNNKILLVWFAAKRERCQHLLVSWDTSRYNKIFTGNQLLLFWLLVMILNELYTYYKMVKVLQLKRLLNFVRLLLKYAAFLIIKTWLYITNNIMLIWIRISILKSNH